MLQIQKTKLKITDLDEVYVNKSVDFIEEGGSGKKVEKYSIRFN